MSSIPHTSTFVDDLDNDALLVSFVGDLHALVALFKLFHGHGTNQRVDGGTVWGKTVAIIASSVLQIVARVPKHREKNVLTSVDILKCIIVALRCFTKYHGCHAYRGRECC